MFLEDAAANRRAVLTGAITALAATGANAQTNAARPGPARQFLESCAADCFDSYRECIRTAQHGTARGGAMASADLLALMLDCASMCQTTGTALLRGGEHYRVLVGACARLCELCARRCEAFGRDAQFRRCVASCLRCARSCRELTGRGI